MSQLSSLNETPRGDRLHIAIFGRRNAGKSSLINTLAKQSLAIVSEVPGTTTDPVYKAMEILPLGPVVLIDTAGIDDVGSLGALRIQKTMEVLERTDLLLLVADPSVPPASFEKEILEKAALRNIPAIIVFSKIDLYPGMDQDKLLAQLYTDLPFYGDSGNNRGTVTSTVQSVIYVSSTTGRGIEELKLAMVRWAPKDWCAPTILGDLIRPGGTVLLVVPIDTAAPKGRIILPQVQTIRDILDHHALALVVKENELKTALDSLNRHPDLVVTDSQVFEEVAAVTPADIPLTSFSILFARYKGNLATLAAGAAAIEKLRPGDRVLVAEACTHHRMADDIGTMKIPGWLEKKIGGPLDFAWVSGRFPENLDEFKLVVHCGGCMINRKDMLHRLLRARAAGVPAVNYGVAIGYLKGILERALKPFPAALAAYLNSRG